LLLQLEDARPAAVVVLGAGRVRVAGLVEVELLEPGVRAKGTVLGALERRALRGDRERVGLEGRGAVDSGVVDRLPLRLEARAVGVQGDLVGRVDRRRL